MNEKQQRGFTLVELLVVIAIIGVMVAMLIPAVQASREMGRRAVCQTHLGQLMLAAQSYENAFESFPAGVINPDGPIRNEPRGLHQGWLIQMLPYLDHRNAYRLIDSAASVYDPINAQVRELTLPVLICPSEPSDVKATSNYAGCHHDVEAPIAADNRGVLFLNSHVTRDDIADGSAFTILAGEKVVGPDDLGWMSGTRATLRNTGQAPNMPVPLAPANPQADDKAAAEAGGAGGADPALVVGGFGSAHTYGVFVGFADGSTRFITEDIDLALWQRMASRADGKLVDIKFDE